MDALRLYAIFSVKLYKYLEMFTDAQQESEYQRLQNQYITIILKGSSRNCLLDLQYF